MEWMHINNFERKSNTLFVSCDTRDFYMSQTDTDPRESSIKEFTRPLKFMIAELEKTPEYLNKLLLPFDECITYLKSLEIQSGGINEWRFLSFDDTGSDWTKYIRFFKYRDDLWLMFSESQLETKYDGLYPIEHFDKHKPENIKTNFLNVC